MGCRAPLIVRVLPNQGLLLPIPSCAVEVRNLLAISHVFGPLITSTGIAMLWLPHWELKRGNCTGKKWDQLVILTTSKLWKERSLLVEQDSESVLEHKYQGQLNSPSFFVVSLNTIPAYQYNYQWGQCTPRGPRAVIHFRFLPSRDVGNSCLTETKKCNGTIPWEVSQPLAFFDEVIWSQVSIAIYNEHYV